MKRFLFYVLSCVSILSIQAQTVPELFRQIDPEKMNHWVDSVFDSLTPDERIAQLFMPVVNPTDDTRNLQLLNRYVTELKVGGILFQKGNAIKQAEVTNRIQKLARVPLMISLDGEWGLSMRLDGTTRFPKNMMLGAIEDPKLIEAYGEEVGRQCNEMGIHVNFAPDMDVNSNMSNPVIGIRSFGENPEMVAEKGIAYSRGLERKGVIAVAKHFPGHGDTAEDSHHTLPAVRHDRSRLDSVELYPFKRFIYEGFAGVMTGHLYVPALDKTAGLPSSLSRPIVTGLLKEELGFQGLCFTDALAMKGATNSTSDNPVVKALKAGNDIILASASPVNDFAAVKTAISNGTLDLNEVEEKCIKVLQYKYIVGLNNYEPIEIKGLSERLNTPHAEWLVSKLNAEAITLMKNNESFLPVADMGERKIAALSLGEGSDNDFYKMLNRYDSVASFSLGRNATETQIRQVYDQLEKYDLIICGVHTSRIPESAALRQLVSRKDVVLAFFTLPYSCRAYRQTIEGSKAVVMAYEGTTLAQEFAAQVIFGGIAAKGKLPVSIPELYYEGTGEFTEKCRLGFHKPEEAQLDPHRLEVIKSIVKEGLEEAAYPGCQVLVAKDGFIIFNEAFGYQDANKNEKVTVQTVYDLASVSKAAGTLLGVMKAYDEKKFTLNTKISDFISELKESDKKDIIIRDMLYHQSGLVPTINFYLRAIDKDSYKGSLYSTVKRESHPIRFDAKTFVRNDFKYLPEIVSRTPKAGYTSQVTKDFYINDSFNDSILLAICDSKLGTKGRYRYSCVNFILLKMMVEKQFGQPMDELLSSAFYRRIGAITTTYNPLRKMDPKRIAPTENDLFLRGQLLRGYVHDEAAAFQGGVSGNAGLFSNAQDLAKVLQMTLDQGVYGRDTLLSPETVRLFTQSKAPNSRRGLGFDKPLTTGANGSPCGALAPASVYGHTGYTGTCFWVDPDSRLIYIFLTNRVNPSRTNTKLFSLDIRTRIQDAIYKSIIK